MTKLLTHEDIPRWYTLTIDQQTGFPCFRIYNEILESMTVLYDPRFIEHFRSTFKLNRDDFHFHDPIRKFFGFGEGVEKIDDRDNQSTYRLNLPVTFVQTDEPCGRCEGTKQYLDHEKGCPYCKNSGLQSKVDWLAARALTISANILSNQLRFADDLKRSFVPDRKQLLTLVLVSKPGRGGSEIGGDFSPSFIEKISLRERGFFLPAEEAMIRVHDHMSPQKIRETIGYERRFFRVEQQLSGNLFIHGTGDRSFIHPLSGLRPLRPNEGYTYASHNVDIPIQQLTLLTGLAAVCDLVEK
jgi:hypothetical protein